MKSIKHTLKKIQSIRSFQDIPKNKSLFFLSFLMIFIILGLLCWIYRVYFQSVMEEGFTQSLMYNVTNSCSNLATDLKEHLQDPSNADLSGNTYYIERLLKESKVKESVYDLSNQLDDFNTNYCDKKDCSGIPQTLIQDISHNITQIGDILNKMDTTNEKIKKDYKNLQQFYELSFDCSGGVCQ